MNAKNYRLALASMDKIRKKTDEINKAYRKLLLQGLELFNDLLYDEPSTLNLSSTHGSYILNY